MHYDGTSLEDDLKGRVYDHRLMKRLLPFLVPHWPALTVALALILAGAGLELVFPYITKIAIDRYIMTGNEHGLLVLAAALLLVLVLQLIVGFGEQWLLQMAGQRIMRDIRKRLLAHLLALDIRYYDRTPVGKIMTRVTSDVDALNDFFTSGLVSIAGDLFMLCGILIMLLMLNWRLALVTFTVLPLIFLATEIFRRRVRVSYRKIREAVSRMNGFLQEYITGMNVVQLFGQERRSFGKFEGINRQHLNAFQETILYYSVFYPVVELIAAIATALILLSGGHSVLAGALTIGEMVAFLQYARRFFQPISDLSEKFNIFQSAMAAAERVFAVLDVEAENRGPAAPVPPRTTEPTLPPSIEFRDVTFSYAPDKVVLHDVSFRIGSGERVAIVGATGSGKTTIIHLLLRLYRPQSGRILIDGRDLDDFSEDEIRARVGMVSQDVFLFSDTIAENIAMGDTAISPARIEEACRMAFVHDFISQSPDGYARKLAERGSDLSQGQRQLLSIARALAYGRPALILDEATSSVDMGTERLIQRSLETLLTGRTALIVAHRLSTVESADRIIVLHKGRIREEGTQQDLLALKGLYYRFHMLQAAQA